MIRLPAPPPSRVKDKQKCREAHQLVNLLKRIAKVYDSLEVRQIASAIDIGLTGDETSQLRTCHTFDILSDFSEEQSAAFKKGKMHPWFLAR